MAAPFNALSYEAGGGLAGVAGVGFSVSSGGFFTADGAGSNISGGGASNFNAGNEQEFDSHFALDSVGPSARNRSTGTSNNSNATLNFYGFGAGTLYGPRNNTNNTAIGGGGDFNELEHIVGGAYIAAPGSHIGDESGAGVNENLARAGIGVAPPPVGSTFAPNATGGRSAFDGVFVARFTVKAGETISGGMFFNTLVSPGVAFGADLVLGGPGVLFQTHNGPQVLALRGYRIATVNLANPSTATAEGVNDGLEFGEADVWDLWVQVIPTPGAVALFGLGGLASIRRRRA
jgi:hypothetical protein